MLYQNQGRVGNFFIHLIYYYLDGFLLNTATPELQPSLIPLSLYVHIPWCVRKCPYCDFNSHKAPERLDESGYLACLLADLQQDSELVRGRDLVSVFFGGGTPSLFSPAVIGDFLQQAEQLVSFSKNIEITLEANPGAVDTQRFVDFRAAGINRLSLGIQSLDDHKLHALGRIHGRQEAIEAILGAQCAGFENINLDLMYGLPEQSVTEALQDLHEILKHQTNHVSWYQLTLEPNTLFYRQPPLVPDEDVLADMMQAGLALFVEQGFQRYEISAFSQQDQPCRHNLNYWQFGDYLGVGAGAHSKLTLSDGCIIRRTKYRHPNQYQKNTDFISQDRILMDTELPLEFMLNALRLPDGVPLEWFQLRTGLSYQVLEKPIQRAVDEGLLRASCARLQPSAQGLLFLDDLVALFDNDR